MALKSIPLFICLFLVGCATPPRPCPCLNVHHAEVDECEAPIFEANGAQHMRCHVRVYDEGDPAEGAANPVPLETKP